MRNRLMLIAGALGLGAFWRRAQRRSASPALEADPAAELREKLAQAKVAMEPPAERADADESPGTQPVVAETATPDPGTRRRSVHERARDAIDELR